MTTYTTTAIATNSITNTVTVASISNMVPGLPISFSGVTFGGITQGSTYYIGTIVPGYPTSTITLTSLPGGAVFALTTATGSMTATWTSGGQQMLITVPPGENLNTAFTKINTNFDQLWAAGPVNSNIRIAGDTIYTLNTNGDLVLNPNGTGNVTANAHVIPDTDRIRNLGSPTHYWDTIYAAYGEIGNLNINQITIPVGDLHILGGNNNNFLQTDGNGNLSWTNPTAAAAGSNTQVQYNTNGILDASNTFTFASNTSTVTMQNVTTTGVANLNSVGNVQIAGGVAGYVLQTDGAGHLSWTSPTGNISSILDQQIFGDGSNVAFTLITPSVTNAVLVSINGVLQIPGVAYTVATDTITFTEAPQTSDVVDIRFLVFGERPDNNPGGADGFIQFNSSGNFGGSGNLTYNAVSGNLYSANVSVGGNVTADYYYGDGSHLTGITATANTGTITFANNVIGTGDAGNTINILGPQSTSVSMATGGNSATSQILWATNIGALGPDQINNGVINGNTWGSQISAGNTGVTVASNSIAGLKTWTFGTGGTLSGLGNVIAGSISSTGNVIATGNVSASGNVSGNYILGNVAFATGIPQSYGDSNVYALLNGSAANIIPLANVSYSLGNATNQWADLWVSNGTIYMNSVPITLGAGNVLSVAGNSVVTTTGGSTSLGNIGFVGNTIYDINGINLQNSDLSHGYTAGVLIPSNGNANAIVVNNTYGNVILQSGVNSDPTAAWTFRNNGNVSLPGGGLLGNTYGDNPNAAALQAGPGGYAGINSYDQGQFVQADGTGVYIGTDYTGNTCIWTFDASGNLTLPDFPDVSINYANGQPYGGTSGNPFNQNLNTGNSVTFASVSATGNINSGNIHTGQISATGNIITANGNISGADYITGNFFVGDGSGLSNINVVANTGNITFNNSTIVGPSFGVVPSANSSVYIQPTVDSATRYQFSGGNLLAPGAISAVGNVAGNYILGNGSQLTGLPATYGNSNVTTLLAAYGSNTVSTTGNITAGNITATNIGNVAALNLNGNANTVLYGNGVFGAVTSSGNVGAINETLILNSVAPTGSYTNQAVTQWSASYTGSGGQLLVSASITAFTGGTATRNWALRKNGANVATGTFFFNTSNEHTNLPTVNYIDTTGNVSAATWSIFVGPNLTVDTGDRATILVTEYSGQLNYGDSNVATLLAGFGSNTISTTGNITAGNFVGSGASATLVAGSYNYVFDNGGILTLPAPPTGNEGAEIDFTKAGNSTLSGTTVVMDQYVDRFRFFESGGTTRGAYIDLTQAAAGVGTLLNNRVSGFVNAGTFVTMDNIKATVTTSGQRGLSLATVSGTATCYIGGTYGMNGGTGGSSAGFSMTTTASNSIFSWNFTSEGDTATYILNYSYTKSYRITMMIGGAYNNNMITIERLV